MIAAKTLSELLTEDPLAPVQAAIVRTLDQLLQGVRVVSHPGRVDLSELLEKTVASAPGVGIGWSRVRRAMVLDGSYGAHVEWVAYIVAEARAIGGKRIEKEEIGLAIGTQILRILADEEACFWGRGGILPPEQQPAPELKPLFTVRDASNGTAYYTVTWTQLVADIGEPLFPQETGRTSPDTQSIDYEAAAIMQKVGMFIPATRIDDDD